MSSPQTSPVLLVHVKATHNVFHRFLPLALALLVAGGLLAMVTLAPRALATDLAPDALGGIAGVVRNPQGEPQAGIAISLHQINRNNLYTTKTAADGSYRFGDLLTGIYRIQMQDPNNVYATTYYPAAPYLQEGEDIVIAGNQRTDVDLTLQLAGQITGSVTATDAFSTSNVAVYLYRYFTSGWQPIHAANIEANNVYSFAILPADTYRICAQIQAFNLQIDECYDDVSTVNSATDLVLTAGATISDINLALGDSVDYAQISGRVLTPDNQPLANILVSASPIRTGFAAETRTDSQGAYQLSVQPGEYNIWFRDPPQQYVDEYYQNTLNFLEAIKIKVEVGQTITNSDAQLDLAGHITGVLTVLGQPAPNPTSAVRLERKTVQGWEPFGESTTDPSTGAYQFHGLPAGIYRVYGISTMGDQYQSYIYEGYYGGQTAETATEINLTGGQTQTANFDLSEGPQFAGSLSGRITAGGAPLANAKVLLYRGYFTCCAGLDQIVHTFTDADGNYVFNGLPTRSVRIGVVDPAGIYATTYYTDHIIPVLSTVIAVKDGQPTTGINVDLPLGGTISGRVAQKDGTPVADLYGTVYSPTIFDPSSSPNGRYLAVIEKYIRTDGDGRYTVTGLHAGAYPICFKFSVSMVWDMSGECYGVYGVDGVHVQVVAGATTTADILWGPELMMYLPLIKR